MSDEQVRIDLVADDKASKVIDDVADDVAELEKLEPTVAITADDNASAVIADVAADAKQLSDTDAEIVLKARADAAKAELKSLQDELRQTGDRADTTARQLDKVNDPGGGSKLRGNAIADLTGPLGEASGAASDFAGVFDGLGDISEGVAEKIGVSAESMAGAIGGIGVAVAAAAAAWTYYKGRQEEARRKQKELEEATRDFNKLVREGNWADAAKKLTDTYDGAFDAARKLGLGVGDTTRFITGQTDALPRLNDEIERLTGLIDEHGGAANAANNELSAQLSVYKDLRGQITGAADDYDRANGSLAEQDAKLARVQSALQGAQRTTDRFATAQDRAQASVDSVKASIDKLRGALDIDQAALDFQSAFEAAANNVDETMAQSAQDVLSLKQTVIDTGEALGKSPLQIKTELDKIDQGDLYGTKADVELWFAMNPIIIASKLDRPGQATGGLTGTGPGAGPRSVEPSTIVNVNLPAGARGVDVVRQVAGHSRRAGRRYGTTVALARR